jgi:hypothetical protein
MSIANPKKPISITIVNASNAAMVPRRRADRPEIGCAYVIMFANPLLHIRQVRFVCLKN